MKKEKYVTPQIEVTEIRIEQGFALSDVSGGVEDFDREEWDE